MPKFSDILQFPRAHYEVTVGWEYLEEHIKSQSNPEVGAVLNLNPDFQRAHVWIQEQQIAYVEYVLKGGEVGRNLTFNCVGWMEDWRGPYEIVDGKQRLEAVRAFLRNDFKAFGHHYKEYTDKLRITSAYFNWRVCSISDRAQILQLYLNINAGGTPHTKQELNKVRKMLNKLNGDEIK